jgi:hypothetical protein
MSSSGSVSIGAFGEGDVGLIVARESAISHSSRVESMLVLELAVLDAEESMIEGRDECEELKLMERRKMFMIASESVFLLSL